jgi:O-antigen ligase
VASPSSAAGRAVLPPAVRDGLERLVAESPGFAPCLIGVGVFLWFTGDEGGFRGVTFLPAAVLLLALLAVSLAALPRPRPSRFALAAIGLLAGYALWSYLSITWAEQKGIAWDGANRAVLYAIVLALFSLWPMRGRHAAVLLGIYGLGVAAIGLVELLKVEQASSALQYFHEGRLSEPAGYGNANVALWFTAFWPCVILAGRREVPPLLRGLFLGASGLLTSLAILGQSRGWLLALPVMVVIAVLAVRGRGRTIVALAAVGIAMAAIASTLTDYYESFGHGKGPPGPVFERAVNASLVAAGLLVLGGLLAALVDRRVQVSEPVARKVSGGLTVALAVLSGSGIVAAAVAIGDPVGEVKERWKDFASGSGEPHFSGSRLVSTSFQSYRSDIWRVAWGSFKRKPITGVGTDNFLRDYLQHGHSDQTPSYTHSLEFRVLSGTGLVGFLLVGGAFGFGLAAAVPALRRGPPIAGAAAGAGVLGFAYFVVHGSADWFWEFPGVGGPAFAMLGLAGAVSATLPETRRVQLPGGRAMVAVGATGAVLIATGLTIPWLAERDLREARKIASRDPRGALDRLDRSSKLNPLSPLAPKTAALVEVRLGRFDRARERLYEALDRDPRDSFAYLELASIASTQRRERRAVRLIDRAYELAPNDLVVTRVRRALRQGQTVTPRRLDRLILENIDVRIGPS